MRKVASATRATIAAAACVAATVVASCEHRVATVTETKTETVHGDGVPRTFELVSGDNQVGTVGDPLPRRAVFVVRDAAGAPVSGVFVTVEPDPPDGSISTSANSVTDSTGKAALIVRLGQKPGSVRYVELG